MNWQVVVAAGLAAVAVSLALPGSGWRRLSRLAEPIMAKRPARRDSTWPVAVGLVAVGVAVASAMGGHVAATCAICGGLVALTLVRVIRSGVAARRNRLRRADIARASDTLAGLLRVGHIPAKALSAAATDCPALVEPAAAQAVGGDVSETMMRTALKPGYEDMGQIASGWRVATATGASLASTMDAVAQRLRADQQVSGVVKAELSAPRATGRLLAALPVAGLVLGYFIGGDPLGFLLGTYIGEACLVAGVALMCAGLLWTDRLADKAGGEQ